MGPENFNQGKIRGQPESDKANPEINKRNIFPIRMGSQAEILYAGRNLKLETLENTPRHAPSPIDFFNAKEEVKNCTSRDLIPIKVNVEYEGFKDGLGIRITPAFFQEYREKRNDPDVPKPTGTAMVLFTTEPDGSRRIMVQVRGDTNFYYGGFIPGASVAGLWNAEWYVVEDEKIKLRAANEQMAFHNVNKEMAEETGILESNMESQEVVGYIQDNINPHGEIGIIGTTKLSHDQIAKRALAGRKKYGKDAEQFIFIPATPEAIHTLLTAIECPLPPSHAAVYALAGYQLVEQQEGQEKAIGWLQELSRAYEENFERINSTVAKFYKEHPEKAVEAVRGKEKIIRNLEGYDAAFSPLQQGLQPFTAEAARQNLLQPVLWPEVEVNRHEKQRELEEGWILDFDGVFTNTETSDIGIKENVDWMINRLRKDEPVVLLTGRSLSFITQRFLPHLLASGLTSEQLDNFLAIGEKGSTQLWFKDRIPYTRITGGRIPDYLLEDIRTVVKEHFDTTMYDGADFGTKQTMYSPEKIRELPAALEDRYKEEKVLLEKIINQRLHAYGLSDRFVTDSTAIAVDLQAKGAGKRRGIQAALEWLEKRNVKVTRVFHTVGDSISDVDMAKEVADQGIPVQYAHLGKAHLNPQDYNFPVINTSREINGKIRHAEDEGLQRILKILAYLEKRKQRKTSSDDQV